jgi:tetratricopeptide (TPR) repeat protein
MVEYASKALEIEPEYGTALAALAIAYTYLGRHDEGEAAARKALALNGSDPDTLGRVAQVLSFAGQHEEAEEIIARAIELDPFGPAQWFNFLSRAQFFAGDFEIAAISAAVCLERSDIQPCLETLAAALAIAGKAAESGYRWNQIVSSRPNAEPEQLVSRLRPAFKRQEDLDLLVRGLSKAKAASAD